MSYFTQRGQAGPIPYNSSSTDASNVTLVGAKFDTSDGREFAIVQNAGTILAAGKFVMGPKPIANHQNLVTTAFTAYSANGNQPAQVTVTLGGTIVTANQYATGFAIVNAGTGLGQTLRIASHPAQATTTGNVVITLEDSPVTALDTTSKISLRLNAYGSPNGTDVRTDGVIVTDHTALTGQILGVPVGAIPASTSTLATYGLVQTKGLVAALNDATTAQGLDIMPSANTDGAFQTYVAATATRLGVATQAGVTTEYRNITVQL